ncbi:hypothetical protein [Methylobacterium planeticum]|uniref:DUF3617 family protein n=1 Tax=Methylobacterium planeticum TaxID=2615211 RepID=A0A6N6MLQ5_9HYPH|nr:hypothetical protein [Methylobacterium planeticum]KAB1072182.1 hypothetical protein F6X51_17320 [Methylobacterium planeticum]
MRLALMLAMPLAVALATGAQALSLYDPENPECRWSKAMRSDQTVRCPGEASQPRNDDEEVNWCGKVVSVQKCAQEVMRVEKILRQFDTEEKRAGRMLHNRGNSLVGCSFSCSERVLNVADDSRNPEQSCTYELGASKQFEAIDARLKDARVVTYIKRNCSARE